MQDPLLKVNLGDASNPRPTYISANFEPEFARQLKNLLWDYRDCVAWDVHEMPGLDRKLVEHRLPIKQGYKPYKQPPRRMTPELTLKVKEEVEKLLSAGFIRPVRYAEWISNIVPVVNKNG